MFARYVPLIASLAVVVAPRAKANAYDDCILQHMANTQNQTAAFAIESACINKASVLVPNPVTLPGGRIYGGAFYVGQIEPSNGFVVVFTNSTPYDATELTLLFINKKTRQSKTYKETNFRSTMMKGSYATELPEPRLGNIIKAGSSREVFFEASDISNVSEFLKEAEWGIIVTKGIPER